MRFEDLEHFPDEAFGRPIGQRDLSTGLGHAPQLGGDDVGAVLRALASEHPATQTQLFGADGQLNRYVNVYLNDEDVRVLNGLDTSVGESDTLVILPAMAGGV